MSLLSHFDISKWNTDNVNNMENIFQDCFSLINLEKINCFKSALPKNLNCKDCISPLSTETNAGSNEKA